MGRNKGKKGKGFPILIAIAMIAWWMMRDDSPSSPGSSTEATVQALSSGDSYAMHFDRSWPALSAQGEVGVADNLIATNYYLVLDGSGSMQESECSGGTSKMDAAKTAIVSFASQIPASANLGLAVFDGNGLSERSSLTLSDRDALNREVMLVQANAGTPLRSAIELGYAALEQQAKRQLGYGEYHLVVITDGEANQGQDPTPAVNTVLASTSIVLHTIGFCIGDRHSLNQPGRIDYRAADDPAALQQSLSSVLAESPDFTVTDF